MGKSGGFFQLLLLGIGVLTVFTLIAYMPTMGFERTVWEDVRDAIAPLIVVICFLGFAAYVVTHR